jgi:hypothetical protein
MRRETRRPGDLESFPVFNVVLIVGIITLLGFAVGVRPRRQVQAVRFWAVLTTFSVLDVVATSVLVSEGWFRLLNSWGVDEIDMIGVYAIVALISLAGSLVLLPAWGYVIGRTVSGRRVQGARKARLKASLDGW